MLFVFKRHASVACVQRAPFSHQVARSAGLQDAVRSRLQVTRSRCHQPTLSIHSEVPGRCCLWMAVPLIQLFTPYATRPRAHVSIRPRCLLASATHRHSLLQAISPAKRQVQWLAGAGCLPVRCVSIR